MSIYWRDDLATGIANIDDQHREIFNRFELFSAACTDGHGCEELSRLIDFLSGYTARHFRDEELVMEGAAYPELSAQKSAHESFLEDFTQLKLLVQDRGPRMETVITEKRAMIQWLVNHICHMDKAFADFIGIHR